MISDLAAWLDDRIFALNTLFPDTMLAEPFMVRALVAVALVGLLCGSMGSMVVGNRMAFFSDALAHCAFAGVALGLLVGLILGAADESFSRWITLIMVVFGMGIGLLIAVVRERTGLSSDTVIGVFFAAAVGLGGVFERAASGKRYFKLEQFLFGDPLNATAEDLLWLLLLVPPTMAYLWRYYNPLVFASFNTSLARSRRLPVRASNYLFIVLLALIINVSIQVMGVLLITGLLIVPAAAAANISRNLRQFFWWSVVLALLSGLMGPYLAWEVRFEDPAAPGMKIDFGVAGACVVFASLLFFLSMWLGPRLRNPRPAATLASGGEKREN